MPSRRRTRSARQKSGAKRFSIEGDSAYSPGLSTSEMKGRPTSYGLRRQYSDTVELLMECQEEELLPAQIEAFKREVEEYKEARRKVKAAKDEQMRLEQQQIRQQKLQQQQQQQQQKQIATAPQQNAVSPSTTTSQADVVIVGESPPKQMAAAQPAVSNAARLLNPTPQQVYKFVNVPGQTTTATGNQWVIRPLMQVMPQQNVGNNQLQPRNQSVNIQKSPFMPKRADSFQNYPQGQFQPQGIQVTNVTGVPGKRPLQYPQYVNPPKKKPRRLEADDIGTLVPLDEYYYGKKEGDPTYQEEKEEHRFKCWYCSKMLYNNVKTMMHMQGHIDSEKQQNLDLSDLTQCKHCYKQFDTPFEMQTHIEKVHMNNTNVLLCRICEKDHESRQSLTSHMRQNHNACEMPYICQLCHFRSSMYSDVVDHFKKKHENSECLLCLYCLKVFHVKFVSQGWGQTQNYYHHLLRHQSKTNAKKCQLCKLTFFNAQEVKAHRKRDHMPNQKGVIGMNAKYTTPDQVMIRVPESGLQPKQLGVKSLNAPAVSKVSEHRGLRYPRAVQELHCFECKMIMATTDHYKKYIQCSMCRFATSCSFAYANHMMGFHSGQITSLSLNIPWERSLPGPMYCLCGFGSRYGNTIANHLVFCTKRSCYKEKPILPPKEDRVDEEQDPRRRPGASLLDVLGLVKKPNIVSKKRFTSAAISEKILPPDPPEETRDPSIPPELTGARRWLTVKLKDDKTPTKASVFGTDDSGDRPFTPEPEETSNDASNIDSLVQSALADSEEDEEVAAVAADKDKGDGMTDSEADKVQAEDEGEKDGDDEKAPDKDEDKESGDASVDKDQTQGGDEEAVEKGEESEQEPEDKEEYCDKDTKEAVEGSDKEKAEESMDTSVVEDKDTKKAVEGSDKEKAEEGMDTSVVEEKGETVLGDDEKSPQPDNSKPIMSEASEAFQQMDVDEANVQPDVSEMQPDSEVDKTHSESEVDKTLPESEASETQPEAEANETQPEADSNETQPESEASETQPEADSNETQPESEASETHPEAEASETHSEPEASETHPEAEASETHSEPEASETQPEAEASETHSEPEASETHPEAEASETHSEPEASETHPEAEASETQPEAEASETHSEPEANETQPEPEASETQPEAEVSEVSKTVDESPGDSSTQLDAEEKQEHVAEGVAEGEEQEASQPETSVTPDDTDKGGKDDGETMPEGQEISVSHGEKPSSQEFEKNREGAASQGTEKVSSPVPEEGEQLTSTDKNTEVPEEAESVGKTGDEQPAPLPPSQPPSAPETLDSTKDPKTDSAKTQLPSDSQRLPNKHYSHERARDSEQGRSHDHYRDRSDDRDRHRSHDRDRDRSHDYDRSRDRGYDRDRDRREQHRSDRDRYGGHGGGYGGGHRYDDRRYPNDNRNYNRHQGGHDRNYGGYHGNQPQQGGYRDNYGNQRDRYGQSRGQGHHDNRDYRGRGGHGYRGNY
ncbi:uncharacterized protein LOC124115131 isoform X3 [Haliotis rufescens]|uniref:uncharacterized protein LOC124115131 isoform X3 n=1 Tax=Haliotis rufescens TaxID=6454 RepID=UPI00201F4FD1|nr:uncharacterized protein LOC124115131 isoform X3 [Haliotis rufescens]